MSRKILMHLGYPKAASTTMQNNVFLPLHHSDKINFLGRAYESNYAGVFGKPEFKHWTEQIISDDFSGDGAYHKALPEIVDNRINVLSENRFLIHYALHGDRKILTNLRSYFKNQTDSIDVVFIIRSQPSIIFSWFLQRYRALKYETFEAFVSHNHTTQWQRHGTAMFHYDSIIPQMQNIFGANNVHVVFFEDLIHMPDAFASQWGTLLGLNGSDVLPLLDKPSKNVTPRLTNNGEIKKYRPKKQPKRSVYERLLNRMGFTEKSFIELDPMTLDQEQLIKGGFRESNIRLAEQLGLDLVKLGKYNYI